MGQPFRVAIDRLLQRLLTLRPWQEQRIGKGIWSDFLGRAAPFPQGPFVLAAALRCPVLLMFALQQQGKLRIHCEPFADPLLLPRAQRQQALQCSAC